MTRAAEREASWTREELVHVVDELRRRLRHDALTKSERKILEDQLDFYARLKERQHGR